MPVHEGSNWIGATLDSLIDEASDELEIIVLDSSPTGSTAEIVKRYEDRLPIRLLMRQDLGPWQSKTNLGVSLALADHCCILHQDDLWLTGRTQTVRQWLERGPEVALHLAPTMIVDSRGRRLGNWRCPLPAECTLSARFLSERLLVQNFISVPAPVFRRDVWLACGGMDEQLWYTPDWDIWLKFAAKGPVTYHDAITTAFRVHRSSLTVSGSQNAAEFRSQMEIVLARHISCIEPSRRPKVSRAAEASIYINVALAAAATGNAKDIFRAAKKLASLGPIGMAGYLRDSRLLERVLPRLRSMLSGAY